MEAAVTKQDFEPIDLMDPAVHSFDPWPVYTWLREECPLYWDSINELWCVSRYDDIREVATRPEDFWSTEGNVPLLPPDPSFINTDGRVHVLRRKLIHEHFKPKAIARLEDHIRAAVDDLIDGVIEQGHCDFVDDIAAPLPCRIVGEMTGIPKEMLGDVRIWLDTFGKGGSGPEHITEEVNEAFINFGALHYDLVDQRREQPQDDLLSIWLQAEIDGVPMDDDEVLFEHVMMIFGGSETARNAISGGVEVLAKLTDQRQFLIDNPEWIGNAADESIRWVTPFIRMSRTATRDAELLGTTIKQGDELIMLYPPASRDPRRFDDPETFTVKRHFKHKNIAFGHGPHYCIGAFLARAEARITYEQILKRMPDWRVAGDPEYVVSSFIRGLVHLPLEFTPGPRVG